MTARPKGGRSLRWVRRILLRLTGLAILLAATIAFLGGTNAGGRLALSVAQRFFPEDLRLEVGSFSGRLLGRFELADVRLGIPTLEAEARRVVLEWKPSALLVKRLRVRVASLEGVGVELRSPPPDSTSHDDGAPPDSATSPPGAGFPLAISFDSVRVSSLAVRMGDTIWISDGNAGLSGTLDEFHLWFHGQSVVPGTVASDMTITGSGSATAFHAATVRVATLKGGISGSADVTWWPELSWVARLEAKDLEPAALFPEPDQWPGRVSFAAETRGRMSRAGGLEAAAAVDTLFGVLRGERLEGRFDVRMSGDEFDVQTARVDWGPASVRATGRVGETIDADFEASVPDLGLVLPGATGSVSASGRATGTGGAARITAEFEAKSVSADPVSVRALDGQVSVDLASDAKRIRVTFAADSLLAGPVSAVTMNGDADLDLSGGVSADLVALDLEVAERSLDSARVILSGQVDRHELQASARGPKGGLDMEAVGSLSPAKVWQGTLVSLRLAADSARIWTLEGPVALTASADAIELSEACVSSPQARLCAAGELSDRLTRLRMTADTFDLARLAPLMPEGFYARAIVNAAVDLRYARGDELTGTAEIRTSAGQVQWVTGERSRTLAFEPITITAASGPEGLRGELELHLADSTQTRMLDISGHVESPLAVRTVEDLTRLRGHPFSAGLEVASDHVLALTAGLLPVWDVTGSFRASVDLASDADGLLTGALEAEADGLEFRNTVRGQGWVLTAEPVRIQATVGPEGLAADLDVEVSGARRESLLTASGRLSLPRFTSLDFDPATQPVEGQLDIEAPDLSFLEAILLQLSEASGTFDLHTQVSGTLADATVQGEARLRDGRVLIPSLGLDLSGIQLVAIGRPEGGFDVDGEVRSGSGAVTIRGRSERYPSPEAPTQIQVRGERFRVADIPELQIDADPALDVLFDGSTLQLNGQVRIPRARIGIPDIPEAAITPSEDVVIVGDSATVREPPVPFGANLTVALGDEVIFSGFGLSGNLDGELQIRQQPGGEPTGRGELRLNNGTYRALGQELRIDPGRLVFNGPIDDPGVDARAFVRASDQTEAGFRIRGTVQNLDVSTYSVPPKTESDIMAYILFGRPMSETTGTEGSEASNTAAVMGANMLAMSLAPSLGLDEARIDTGSSQNKAQLVVGKYLSPKLYVGYGVGLYEPISTFRVRYLLSARWSIEAITGDEQSTDLLYRIERGGARSETTPAQAEPAAPTEPAETD